MQAAGNPISATGAGQKDGNSRARGQARARGRGRGRASTQVAANTGRGSSRGRAKGSGRASRSAANAPSLRSKIDPKHSTKSAPTLAGKGVASSFANSISSAISSQPARPRSAQSRSGPSKTALSTDTVSVEDGRTAGSYQDRYEKLKIDRARQREEAIRQGQMADPNQPTSLNKAITPVGTCTSMCPEYERVERIVQKMVDRSEKYLHPASNTLQIVESKMLKRFRRSAAGYDEQLPSDIRTPKTLLQTMNYLIRHVINGPEPLGVIHKFVWDRTRSIRNDFSVQQLTREDHVRMAVTCLERIARFHILSLHLLSSPSNHEHFDHHQEREQLNNTMLSLMYYYDDNRGRIHFPNEEEFRAYYIVFAIHDQRPDLETRIQKWPVELLRSPKVQVALELYAAASNTWEYQGTLDDKRPNAIAQGFYSRFFNLVDSPSVSYLMACVAEIYFNNMRQTAIRSIWKGYCRSPISQQHKNEEWTLEELTSVLYFDDDSQTEQFCLDQGLEFAENADGQLYLNWGNRPIDSVEFQPTTQQTFSETYVESKRGGRTLAALILGLNIKQAAEYGMIDSSLLQPQDVESMSVVSDESLFVPEENAQPAVHSGPQSAAPSTTQVPSVPEPNKPLFATNGISSGNSLGHQAGINGQPNVTSSGPSISSSSAFSFVNGKTASSAPQSLFPASTFTQTPEQTTHAPVTSAPQFVTSTAQQEHKPKPAESSLNPFAAPFIPSQTKFGLFTPGPSSGLFSTLSSTTEDSKTSHEVSQPQEKPTTIYNQAKADNDSTSKTDTSTQNPFASLFAPATSSSVAGSNGSLVTTSGPGNIQPPAKPADGPRSLFGERPSAPATSSSAAQLNGSTVTESSLENAQPSQKPAGGPSFAFEERPLAPAPTQVPSPKPAGISEAKAVQAQPHSEPSKPPIPGFATSISTEAPTPVTDEPTLKPQVSTTTVNAAPLAASVAQVGTRTPSSVDGSAAAQTARPLETKEFPSEPASGAKLEKRQPLEDRATWIDMLRQSVSGRRETPSRKRSLERDEEVGSNVESQDSKEPRVAESEPEPAPKKKPKKSLAFASVAPLPTLAMLEEIKKMVDSKPAVEPEPPAKASPQVDEDEILLSAARIAAEDLKNGPSLLEPPAEYSRPDPLLSSVYLRRSFSSSASDLSRSQSPISRVNGYEVALAPESPLGLGRTLSRTEERIRRTGAKGLAYKPLPLPPEKLAERASEKTRERANQKKVKRLADS